MNFAKAALLAGCATVIATVAPAETFNIQTSFNAGDFSTQYLTETWLPQIKERTDGRVEVILTPNSSVVPARDTQEAIAAGVIDGDWTSASYFVGVEPAYGLLGDLIAGYDTPEQMMGFCREGGGEALFQKAADSLTGGEVKVVACGPYSREALASRVPIRTFEDLQGKKIRSPEGMASAVFQAAGASPSAFRSPRSSGRSRRASSTPPTPRPTSTTMPPACRTWPPTRSIRASTRCRTCSSP